MKLKTLYIKDFKNIHEQTFDFSQHNGLTLLIGSNGSGKSNLLECISSIFLKLYTRDNNFETDFKISYEIGNRNIDISYIDGELNSFNQATDLPKRIIATYSGDELRMWENYYQPLYDQFIRSIRENTSSGSFPRMLYLNKYYWNIALLSLLTADTEDCKNFVENILHISDIESIKFLINRELLNRFASSSALLLAKSITSEKEYTLQEFKNLTEDIDASTLFMYLWNLCTPKDEKIITDISIKFNSSQSLKSLSEGHKKLLLAKAALEFAGSEDTLYLFDEPDAHIHIENKIKFIDILKEYSINRHIILSTHSPVLTNICEGNIIYLNHGSVKETATIDLIKEISGNKLNYITGGLILTSGKPLILVEGVGDIEYIKRAISVLSPNEPRYNSIDWDFLYMGGAGKNAKQFIDAIKPSIEANKRVIAIFDRDDSGRTAMKELTGKGNKEKETIYRKENFTYMMLPKTPGHTYIDFTIEDYFSTEYKKTIAREKLDACSGCFNELPTKLKDNVKDELSKRLERYTDREMAGFKTLLDKILDILNGTDTSIIDI